MEENQQATARENIMGTMNINPLLVKLSVPMMVSMLVQALYNVVDSIFVSHVSESALTAVSLAFSLQNVMIAVGVGTGVGVNALLSKSLGEKNQERANTTAENGIFLALCSYVIFFVIGLTCMKPYFYAQTSDPDIALQGIRYLRVCSVFSLGLFLQTMGEKLLAATGRTNLSMTSQLIGAVVNIVLDPIFIFGYCGEALSGTTGAAVATVIGQFCGAGAAIFFNLKKNPDIQISFRGFRPSGEAIRRGPAQHCHAVRGQRDDVLHEPDPHGVLGHGGGGVRRLFQAAELRVHAHLWPEQRDGAHHQLQLWCPGPAARQKDHQAGHRLRRVHHAHRFLCVPVCTRPAAEPLCRQ